MALSYNLGYQEIISVHPTRRQIFAGKPDSTFSNIWQWVIFAPFFFLVKHVSLFSLSSMFLWYTALNILLQLSLYILPWNAGGVHYAMQSLLKVMLKRARRVECWSKYVFVRRQMEGSMICFHRVRDRNSGLDFATLPPLSPTKP